MSSFRQKPALKQVTAHALQHYIIKIDFTLQKKT